MAKAVSVVCRMQIGMQKNIWININDGDGDRLKIGIHVKILQGEQNQIFTFQLLITLKAFISGKSSFDEKVVLHFDFCKVDF